MSASNKTIQSIKYYMIAQEALDPPTSSKEKKKTSTDNNTSSNGNNNQSQCQMTTTTNEDGEAEGFWQQQQQWPLQFKSQQLNATNRDQPVHIQPQDNCPLPGHQGHTWGECYQSAADLTTQPQQSQGPHRDAHINKHCHVHQQSPLQINPMSLC
jgi:hypothetical protein